MIGSLFIEFALDSLELFSIQDGRLLAGKNLTFKRDITDVEPVAKEVRKGASGFLTRSLSSALLHIARHMCL